MPPPAVPRGGRWERSGDGEALSIDCADRRRALSPGFLAGIACFAALAAVIAVIAGAGVGGAILALLCTAGIALPLVFFMRLSLVARRLELRFDKDHLEIRQGSGASTRVPLAELSRLVIVHDGAPARIRIDSASLRRSWTIGQLYRHNAVERFVPVVPADVHGWLSGAGLVRAERSSRGISTSEYRRADEPRVPRGRDAG